MRFAQLPLPADSPDSYEAGNRPKQDMYKPGMFMDRARSMVTLAEIASPG